MRVSDLNLFKNAVSVTKLLLILLATSSYLIVGKSYSNELSEKEELQQIMEFDQACIIMHQEGSKYLQSEEKIIQSNGASALIEQHLETTLLKYSEMTGDDAEYLRSIITQRGNVLFNELSVYHPKALVSQCRRLVDSIVKTKL